jgi:2-keto-4-pentenoate hydratase/2-oxohepta-3-ene-1,7-dioic acid hydratase in catechol pathway
VRIVRFRIEGKTRYGVLDGAAVVEYAGTPWSLFRRGRRRYPLRQVVLLAPVLPSKIVGIGFSHREHTAGLGRPGPDDPLVFFKPISALVGPDDPIVAPPQSKHVEARDGDWTRAKAFDTFCPVGPCIATDLDPHAATLETWVNGTLRASASTTGLVFAVEDVLARVSEIMTLLPGDVIAAGAPGVSGPVDAGDRVEIRIEGVGALKNTVVRL